MDIFIKPVFAAGLQTTGGEVGKEFDLSYDTLADFIQLLTPLAFSVAAVMVIFYFIIGAFELITSQGDKGHIVSARAKIYHSIIGFVLLIIVFLVMQYLGPAIGLTGFKLFQQ